MRPRLRVVDQNGEVHDGENRLCETCGAAIARVTSGGAPIRPAEYLRRRYCGQDCARRRERPIATIKGAHNRARRLVPLRSCDECGAPGRDRHHIDGNPFNNVLANIAVLCRRCHMEADGRMARFVEAAGGRITKPLPAKPCAVCKRQYKPLRKGRCSRCDRHWRMHGSEWGQ